jgi:phospholipase/carboxylesterase
MREVMTRREFLAAAGTAGAMACARPTSAAATDGTAEAASYETDGTAQAAPYRIGQQPLKLGDDRDGLVYIPRGYKADVAMPLILMLHGAGNTSLSVTYTFEIADDLGLIILAPDSRDEATWDMLVHGFGEDVEFIGAALKSTYARCAVDRKRMAIAGHSDGASYALSLGLGTGDTFGHILAFSPGVMQPAEVHGKPRIFISHGLSDQTMPIDITSRRFVPRLKGLGYDVTYREYEGRHGVPPAIVREGFEWFLR